eukprot:g12707.t1
MARTIFVALACGVLGAANALEVTAPNADMKVVAETTYTVEWTGTTEGRFEIDLYKCGSMCEDECGEWVTALCPYGEDGCPDSKGDYDIKIPEPEMVTSDAMYKVRVANAADEDDYDCSDAFSLLAAADAPKVGDDGYYLEVTSPSSGDVGFAGQEYTIEWDYMNGLGSSVDRFSIMLYPAGCTGGMVSNLCDKPTIGCKDSMGDYDVEIPDEISTGMYSIRVGRFEDDDLFGCSEPFMIEGNDDDMSMSMSFF